MPIKRRVFLLLQESQIPPTDKIFPWIVETMINRVSMEALGDQLEITQQGLFGLSNQISHAVGQAVASPVRSIQSSQTSVENLTVELRKNSVIQASLRQSGWRRVICALEAIPQHKILGLTVVGISLISALLAGAVTWQLSKGDRQTIQFNRQTIQNCYDKFAVDKDGNGWFSCSNIQLPMP